MKSQFPAAALLVMGLASVAQADVPLPRLERNGQTIQLKVDGKPFLMLAGELHNSSASSPAYMAPIWDRLAAMNLNTVIGTVSWELLEPEQGKFDFSLVDDEITQARKHKLRLVLIWFASFKNAQSHYAPSWVRRDLSTYPRVVRAPDPAGRFRNAGFQDETTVELTPFNNKLLERDTSAFATLMRHIRDVDQDHTVIMIQVENEVGILGDSRDRSPLAEAAWTKPVPTELVSYLTQHAATLRPELAQAWERQGRPTSGTWTQMFGDGWESDEIFMAWQFGSFVGRVAEAGKKALALPMYANAWLGPQPGQEIAGKFPSGGPVAAMMDVWKAAAPAIDFLAPDVYVANVDETFADFTRADNPLFSPETQPIVGSLFQAIGGHAALGYSVFGIEDVPVDGQIAEAYRRLKPMLPELARAQANGTLRGFALTGAEAGDFQVGNWRLKVVDTLDAMKKVMLDAGMAAPEDLRPSKPEGRGLIGPVMTDKRAGGMILAVSPDEFLLLGSGFTASFSLPGAPAGSVELESATEGKYADESWIPGRRLNGDEQYTLIPVDKFGMVREKFLRPK